jgi:hypothetical protein
MGYDTGHIKISFRTSSHNDERDIRDHQAVEDLRTEIEALIASTPDYKRVVSHVW